MITGAARRTGKLADWTSGAARLGRAVAREPHLLRHLPRWATDAKIRKDPLSRPQPWWHYDAIRFVEERLPQGARVFEYGGGASTLWLLGHGAQVVTIEDSAEWTEALLARAPHADVRLIEPSGGQIARAVVDWPAYADMINDQKADSLDLVIVDGVTRRLCVLAAADKVKPGGMLLLDDSQPPPDVPSWRPELRDLYTDLPNVLDGWSMTHLRGLKPGTWNPVQTTVWIKPR